MHERQQLSLYVPRVFESVLEIVRRVVDPVQSRLIPAHVTLCRDDELVGLDSTCLQSRLLQRPPGPLALEFAPAQVFGGHGILMPCCSGEAEFRALRELILGSRLIREQAPHLTLAHPRNPRAAGNSLAHTAVLGPSLRISFDSIQLIAQSGDQPWRVLTSFALGNPQRQSPAAI